MSKKKARLFFSLLCCFFLSWKQSWCSWIQASEYVFGSMNLFFPNIIDILIANIIFFFFTFLVELTDRGDIFFFYSCRMHAERRCNPDIFSYWKYLFHASFHQRFHSTRDLRFFFRQCRAVQCTNERVPACTGHRQLSTVTTSRQSRQGTCMHAHANIGTPLRVYNFAHTW